MSYTLEIISGGHFTAAECSLSFQAYLIYERGRFFQQIVKVNRF
jgi:hypothetical protein